MFPQASAEDRAGVLLHRIPSGNETPPALNMSYTSNIGSICILLLKQLTLSVSLSFMFVLNGIFLMYFTEPVANKRHGHPSGQNKVLRRYD